MHYQSILIDRIFLVRWERAVRIEDLRAQLEEMREASQALQRPLIHVAVLPESMGQLSFESRVEIIRLVPAMLEVCESVHNVVEGSATWRRIMNAVLAGMVLATGVRQRAYIHASLTDALTYACSSLQVNETAAFEQARAAGVL